MNSGQQPFGICAKLTHSARRPPRLITVDGKVVEFGVQATAQKAARAHMRFTGLAYKPVTTYVKAENAVLEGLGADARARIHFGQHGSNGILQQPPRQAHAECRLM
ncbi:MAG: hypothetical protein ABI434_21165 [Burkholderiaceae bacterium]